MAYETDERLKSYLDTNQMAREQMCLAILAVDRRFTDVVPRHPRGGPDGGRDIEAMYLGKHRAYGAVGFVNQASDSAQDKKDAMAKFGADLKSALKADPTPEAFVFFTNVNLTVGEKKTLVRRATSTDLVYCEVVDRERMRVVLDSPDGFSIRFQSLGLPLSEAEQATFFARWGDDIQSVISTSFARVDATLQRLLFLEEASYVLSHFVVGLELDREYTAEEIGHFRAFCYMHLKEPKHGIFAVIFGSSDRLNRTRHDRKGDLTDEPSGIKHGRSTGQWEQHLEPGETIDLFGEDKDEPEWMLTSGGSSIGADTVTFVSAVYKHDSFVRFSPRMTLRDIDQCFFLPLVNRSLAEKVKAIHVMANGYKLLEAGPGEFNVDASEFESAVPAEFTADELADPWVRLRPSLASSFSLSFADFTPTRLYRSRPVPDSLGWGSGQADE